ncbi:hypothetical protein DFP93_12338 [Aneurinibacillus soli]|uniref:Uncharacterized protein n=1 Tax=Aneurinibacillus soli TaxID=1500254 RepID=A0A0U5BFM2_9BACL|nr:hypothetical protein DFP93_12338 [Aneurinibacillus soli]BAU29469.1 hypothetical protein CB4_03669 [Aneurinibacillus soli]
MQVKNKEATFREANGDRADSLWRGMFLVNGNVVRGVGEGRSKRVPVRVYSAEGER